MYQLNREQLETQARAKVTWGENPESVVTFLISYGLTAPEAWAMLQELQAERAATIRASGVKKILLGAGMLLVPVVTYAACQHAGMLDVKILAVAVSIGIWGGWKLIGGIFSLIFPESEQGDLADDNEG